MKKIAAKDEQRGDFNGKEKLVKMDSDCHLKIQTKSGFQSRNIRWTRCKALCV
ncbi:hypothetical protein [Fictibacillus enclensis]|uniref:hypothetical protein n=1 Tax=Fictibacillus enclensis TaxID=1017270 RepID=UPI003CD0D87A